MSVSDDPAYVQDAFFDYIDRTRIRPFHLQIQYNSWFDTGYGVNRKIFSASVAKIRDELMTKRNVKAFDAYVIDDGWEDTHASWTERAWPVNAKFDPDFATTKKNVENAGSRLGLWLGPGMN